MVQADDRLQTPAWQRSDFTPDRDQLLSPSRSGSFSAVIATGQSLEDKLLSEALRLSQKKPPLSFELQWLYPRER